MSVDQLEIQELAGQLFSHVDRLICFVAFQSGVSAFNLIFSFIVDGNTSDWGPNRTPHGGTFHKPWLKWEGLGNMSPSWRPHCRPQY